MSYCKSFEFVECYATYWIWRTIPIVYLAVGTCGNLLNITILSRARMRRQTMSVYLTALAISDLLFLWTAVLPRIIEKINGTHLSDMFPYVFCQTLPWINHVTGGYSVWLLAAMSFERMLMTKYIIFARTRLTIRNAIIWTCILFVICVFLPLHIFFGYEVQTTRGCQWNEHYGEFYGTTWPVMVLVLLNIIPMIIIIVGNAGILINVVQQKRNLRRIDPHSAHTNVHGNNKFKPMTKMLFIISLFFILTTLPFTLFQIFWLDLDHSTPHALARRDLLDTFFDTLLYSNYTFNFFLYCISGSIFKQEWKAFIEQISRRFRRRNQTAPVGTVSTTSSRNDAARANVTESASQNNTMRGDSRA